MGGFAREQLRRTGGILLVGALLLFNPATAQENSQTAPRPLTTPDAHFTEAFREFASLDDWEADQAAIHWTMPAGELDYIAGYLIRYREMNGDGQWEDFASVTSLNSTIISGLLPEQAYIAQVKARAADGQELYSDSEWAEVAIPRAFEAPEMRLVDIYTVSWQQAAGEPEARGYIVTHVRGGTRYGLLSDEEFPDLPSELRRYYPEHHLGYDTKDIEDRTYCDQRSDGECVIQWGYPIATPGVAVKLMACEWVKNEYNHRFCRQRPTSWRASKTSIFVASWPYHRYPLPDPLCPHHTQLFLFSRTLNLRYRITWPYYSEWICADWRVNLCSAWPGEGRRGAG